MRETPIPPDDDLHENPPTPGPFPPQRGEGEAVLTARAKTERCMPAVRSHSSTSERAGGLLALRPAPGRPPDAPGASHLGTRDPRATPLPPAAGERGRGLGGTVQISIERTP